MITKIRYHGDTSKENIRTNTQYEIDTWWGGKSLISLLSTKPKWENNLLKCGAINERKKKKNKKETK